MVEYYGWANISGSYKVEEDNLDEDLQLRKIIKDLNNKILETKSRAQVQFINGAAVLRCEGYTNHWGKKLTKYWKCGSLLQKRPLAHMVSCI